MMYLGCQIFETLKWYQTQTDRILTALKGKTLSSAQQGWCGRPSNGTHA
jgi:hypothetical protein